MKKLKASPEKFFSQKGQGLLEYALLLGFIAAIFLVYVLRGGFGEAVTSLFGDSNDSLSSVDYAGGGSSSVSNSVSNSSSASASSSSETSTANSTDSVSYKPLNWERDILPFANMTYATITNPKNPNNTVDKTLSSEIGFFDTLLSAAEGGLASTKAADGTKDWETFLTMVDKTKAANNFSSVYVRDEQKITVKTVGKDLRITYSDKEGNYYYKFSPDANNVMQLETNSSKSYHDFFSSVIKNADGGGWEYGK